MAFFLIIMAGLCFVASMVCGAFETDTSQDADLRVLVANFGWVFAILCGVGIYYAAHAP